MRRLKRYVTPETNLLICIVLSYDPYFSFQSVLLARDEPIVAYPLLISRPSACLID